MKEVREIKEFRQIAVHAKKVFLAVQAQSPKA